MVWPPGKYAELLSERLARHKAKCWLINTGWTGGAYGVGSRIKLKHTRAIIDAVHNGTLDKVEMTTDPIFGVSVPRTVPGVPEDVLDPKKTWSDPAAYTQSARKLGQLFHDNFQDYADMVGKEAREAGPRI